MTTVTATVYTLFPDKQSSPSSPIWMWHESVFFYRVN